MAMGGSGQRTNEGPLPTGQPGQTSYSVGMALAVEHDHMRLLRTNNDRYQALVMHTQKELAMLADIFRRSPTSRKISVMLTQRDRSTQEFEDDCKRWSELKTSVMDRPKAFQDDVTISLLRGDGTMPVYQIVVQNEEAVNALPEQFSDVYNSRVTPHRESKFEDALRDVEEIHEEGHELMALYGVFGFRSRFSHSQGYGREEREAEGDETASAVASRPGSGLSPFRESLALRRETETEDEPAEPE